MPLDPISVASLYKLPFAPTVVPDKPAPKLTYSPTSGLLSPKVLLDKMGRPPKTDVTVLGRTIKTNSAAYKGTLAATSKYQSHLGTIQHFENNSMLPAQIKVLEQPLRDAITEAACYIGKHERNDDKQDRVAVMKELSGLANAEMRAIDARHDLKGPHVEDLTLGEAVALARAGIKDTSHFCSDLNDRIVDASKSNDKFGAGAVNSVSLIHYTGKGERVLKPLDKVHPPQTHAAANEATIGIDQSNLNLAARNIVSADVAKLFGVPGMIPAADIVVHKGQAALAMEVAGGETPFTTGPVPITDPVEIGGWADADPDMKAARGVKMDDQGKWSKDGQLARAFPYVAKGDSNLPNDPVLTGSLQKGLLDLQVLDFILGQADRHVNNIFIKVTGGKAQVTGIDNDICLGKIPVATDLGAVSATHFVGLPPLMSAEMYDKLMATSVEDFKKTLGGDLTDEEVSAAVGRFKMMQEHAQALEDSHCVVADFATWSLNGVDASEYLLKPETKSYVKILASEAENYIKLAGPLALDPTKHS